MKASAENQPACPRVLVCFAMKEEAKPFRKLVADKSGVSILITGIGRQNAEKSVREFLAGAAREAGAGGNTVLPDLVLTCGFAGGLNPALKPGDVLFETKDDDLRGRLLSAGAKAAGFFCADRIATTVSEKQTLRTQTGADVVEMESAAIQTVCREHGIRCATVRVISDVADQDLPLDFNALAKPDKNLDPGKLFLAIAGSPGKIGALMRLQKQTSFAARRLADVLARMVLR